MKQFYAKEHLLHMRRKKQLARALSCDTWFIRRLYIVLTVNY